MFDLQLFGQSVQASIYYGVNLGDREALKAAKTIQGEGRGRGYSWVRPNQANTKVRPHCEAAFVPLNPGFIRSLFVQIVWCERINILEQILAGSNDFSQKIAIQHLRHQIKIS